MARILPPEPDQMSERQREVHEAIRSGPRGEVRGPLAVWLRRPELADRAQSLGRYCRYETLLPPRLSELAILTIARVWRAEFEWWAHAPIAREAGLSDAVIEAIRTGGTPAFDRSDEEAVYAFTRAAHETRRVPETLYARAVAVLGEDAVVDLVGILGYYALISLTLNAFEVEPPDGTPAAFGPMPAAEAP